MLSQALTIAVVCERSFLLPSYAGQDESNCVAKDLSRDNVIVPGVFGGATISPHILTFSYEYAVNDSNATKGWQVLLGRANAFPAGGQEIPFTVNVKATPLIQTQDLTFDVHVDYEGPNGYRNRTTVRFLAEVNNYDFAVVSMLQSTLSQKAGQDEVVRYAVIVQNVGVYPDSYRFSVNTDPDIRVTVPPNLYVPPGETRTTYVDVLTPKGKLYEMGRSTAINVKATSVTGSGVYGTVGVLQIRGAHFPIYWIPMLVVGLVSAAVVVRGTREKDALRSAERGRPRPVDVTPRQAVLLAELKRNDPDTYREKKQALDSVYKERVSDYRAHRRERALSDREEARQARQEFLAAKKARKAKRKEEKRAAKIAASQARADAAQARKAEKKEAKLLAKREKVLNKKRAKLEKAKAKADAREAKAAAAQAKLDAKAAKQAERQARKQKK